MTTKIGRYQWILRGIGIYEIIGGLIGMGVISWILYKNGTVNALSIITILFYLYSCYAGIRLFNNRENGLLASQILQLFQVLGISFAGFTYLLSSGGLLLLGFNGETESFQIQFSLLSSTYLLSYNDKIYPDFFYVNLMPFALISLMEVSKNKILNFTRST